MYMGLDHYREDIGDDRRDVDDVDRTDDVMLHLIDQLDVPKDANETQKHYDSKIDASIQLAKLGYFVYIEHEIDRTGGPVADVYAELSDDNSGLGHEEIIVEVGEYSAGRAKRALNSCDCILLVPKGCNLHDCAKLENFDAPNIPSASGDEESVNKVNRHKQIIDGARFINCSGKVFTPKINDIHTNKYKEIASVMLKHLGGTPELTKDGIVDTVNLNSDESYKERDILKVSEELGFITE